MTDSDDKQTYQPWNTGLSTKPDVDALIKQFPPETISPGEFRCTDDEIKAVIGLCEGARFRTVYSSWVRRLLRDHNIIIYRQEMVGFYCPTAEEVFSRTHPTLEASGRKIGKQLRHVGSTRPTSDMEKSVQGHHGRLLHAMKKDLKKARMNLLPPAEVKAAPQITPPKQYTHDAP